VSTPRPAREVSLGAQESRVLAEFCRQYDLPFRDLGLLKLALTHRSYLSVTGQGPRESNERLEFLGDSVLGLVTSEHLYRLHPDEHEGQLTKIKSLLVSKAILSRRALRIGLGRFVLMSHSEVESGGRQRLSILADAFESVIGAIYLDQGFESARRFIHEHLLADADAITSDKRHTNYKSHLQEYVQNTFRTHPVYRIRSEYGPDHSKHFVVEVMVGKRSLGEGRGHNKKEAEQAAARDALEKVERVRRKAREEEEGEEKAPRGRRRAAEDPEQEAGRSRGRRSETESAEDGSGRRRRRVAAAPEPEPEPDFSEEESWTAPAAEVPAEAPPAATTDEESDDTSDGAGRRRRSRRGGRRRHARGEEPRGAARGERPEAVERTAPIELAAPADRIPLEPALESPELLAPPPSVVTTADPLDPLEMAGLPPPAPRVLEPQPLAESPPAAPRSPVAEPAPPARRMTFGRGRRREPAASVPAPGDNPAASPAPLPAPPEPVEEATERLLDPFDTTEPRPESAPVPVVDIPAVEGAEEEVESPAERDARIEEMERALENFGRRRSPDYGRRGRRR
jgi:ribonuclease-3